MLQKITQLFFFVLLAANLGTAQSVLPMDFESTTASYDFVDFDGGVGTVMANPQSSGINTSATVAQIIRDGGQPWGGSKLILATNLDFSVNNTFSMKVFSPAVGTPVLFKLEGPGVATPDNVVNTTVANEWETLTWNFSGLSSNAYNEVVFIFDFGTVGDGSANSTFLFDDVEFIDNSGGLAQMSLPLSFDDAATVFYELVDFEGAGPSAVVVDPTDPANMVATVLKDAVAGTSAGTTMGGSGFSTAIPFTADNTTMSVRVWSPDAGIQIRLKVEDSNNNGISVETEATTTVAAAWDTLVFDFSNQATGTAELNIANTYNKASIFFNFGVDGALAGAKTYYWDDVQFGGTSDPTVGITLPVDFESTTITYAFDNFDGGTLTLEDNPDQTGINTSAKVAKMVKSTGQPWGGSFMTLAGPIDFSSSTTFTMNVWSPAVGTKILLKIENSLNGAIFVEVEETTTTASAWEELTFDFSAINPAESYDRVVLIFELGTVGDGSAAFTYYVDDIQLDGDVAIKVINAAAAGITISPNPAQSFLNIEFKDALNAPVHLMLFDVSGKLLKEENIIDQVSTINVNNLQNGLYFLRMNATEVSYFQKLMIAK